MAKVKITGHASGTGILTVTAPNTSTDRTITLPDATGTLLNSDGSAASLTALNATQLTSGTVPDARFPATLPAASATNLTAIPAANVTGTLPAISGANLTSVRDTTGGRKNMVINGDMQVAQRGTSATGIDTDSSATEEYRTVDRFLFGGNDSGVWTMTQDSESPVEFGSSMKMDCTTAKASLDAGSYLYVLHKIEAQSLQQLAYGTSSAKAITLSFWVRSPKTGTHYAELYHGDSSGTSKRKNSYAYTVSAANTWEKKSMTFAGDTGLAAIVNDNGWGLMIIFYLAAGGNLQGGTNTNDDWQNTEANRAPGQVNCADNTSNNFYLTGVQLELGSVATDFEHRSYGEELALCQRYYQKTSNGTWAGFFSGSANLYFSVNLTCPLRASPTVGFTTVSGGANFTAVQHDNTDSSSSTPTVNANLSDSTNLQLICGGFDDGSDMRMAQMYTGNNYLTFSAEL